MPVLFPSLFVIEHLRWCVQQRKSTAVIFVDTRAACYRLVRQLATGDLSVDHNVEELFYKFGLDGEDIAELRDLILGGGMLDAADVPGPIRGAAWDFHRDSWFVTRFTNGETVCRSTAGSRPGASWADCVFSVIYARILYRVHEQMEGENINFSLDYEPETGLFATSPGGNPQEVWDTTWADDSAYAVTADSPEELTDRTARIGSMIVSAFRSHGLSPNLKRNKKSVIMRLTGKGATKTRHRHFSDGRPELKLRDLGESLQIVPHYKHLGCMVDPMMKMSQEARFRTAMADVAYKQGKDLLLQNRDLGSTTRAMLFQTVVVSTYHNFAVWVASGVQWERMSEAFSRLVRKLLTKDIAGADLFRVPLSSHTGPRDAGLSRSLRGAADFRPSGGQRYSGPSEDLRWLVQGASEDWPNTEAASWPQWWHLLRDHPQWVKVRVKRRNEEDFIAYKESAATDVCLWHLQRSMCAPAGARDAEPINAASAIVCTRNERR